MKRAAEKEKSGNQRSKRFRFAEGLPTEMEAQSYVHSVKEHFKNDRAKIAEFIQILHDFRSKRCDAIGVITRLKQLLKSHKLLLSFNKFLPEGFKILFPTKEFLRKKQKVHLEEALRYIAKIKKRFQNEEYIRKRFFEILGEHMKRNKRVNDIHTEVKSLFCDHQDLADEFAYFLPASITSFLVPHFQASATMLSEPANILTSVKDSHKEHMGKQGQKYFISRALLDSNASEPISEMTPSYRLISQNFKKPMARCSDGIAAEVLNDICVSVPPGAKDYRKQKLVNRYEEAILNCEDDRFELDMLIENSKSAIKRIHELLEKEEYDNTTQKSAHFRIEDHLTGMDLRCIQRIYGDCGLHIIDLLRENPDRCLPLIVKRLQEKNGEWVNCRTAFNRGWADVYAKNYKRSLDHIGSYFKQRDTKRMRTHLHF